MFGRAKKMFNSNSNMFKVNVVGVTGKNLFFLRIPFTTDKFGIMMSADDIKGCIKAGCIVEFIQNNGAKVRATTLSDFNTYMNSMSKPKEEKVEVPPQESIKVEEPVQVEEQTPEIVDDNTSEKSESDTDIVEETKSDEVENYIKHEEYKKRKKK